MKCHGREPFVGDDVADDGNADNNLSGKKNPNLFMALYMFLVMMREGDDQAHGVFMNMLIRTNVDTNDDCMCRGSCKWRLRVKVITE